MSTRQKHFPNKPFLRSLAAVILGGACIVSAQSAVSLSGRIVDRQAQPLSGCRVSVINAGLETQSDNAGKFVFISTGIPAVTGGESRAPFLRGSTLYFPVQGGTQKVILDVYDFKGKKAAAVLNEEHPAGWYEADLSRSLPHLNAGLYTVRLQTGGESRTFKLPFTGTAALPGQAESGIIRDAPLGKGAAEDLDTLAISCGELPEKKVGLSSYSGDLGDIKVRRPNVLFIFTDDQGWGDLGVYGHPYVKTPYLDKLAGEGMRFTQFYVNATVCSPSRTSFMTGHFPARHQVHNAIDWQEEGMPETLDPNVYTVTDMVKSAGYVTGHFGKWHLGKVSPDSYGVDDHRTILAHKHGWQEPNWQGEPFLPNSTDLFVDEGIRFLRAHKDELFYLNLWTFYPHQKLLPTPEQLEVYKDLQMDKNDFGYWMRRYFDKAENLQNPLRPAELNEQMKIWCAAVTSVDKAIGRLLEELDELGLADDTFVFFTSDNGPETMGPRIGEFGSVGSPGRFRGRKRSMYEGGVRMPCIARWPGHVPEGRMDSTSVFSGVDWFPTISSITGIPMPDLKFQPDGEDVSDILTGTSRPHEKPLMWEWRYSVYGVDPQQPPKLAIRDGKWKLFVNPDGSKVELYDIPADPEERNNVAASNAAVVERLKGALLDWKKELP